MQPRGLGVVGPTAARDQSFLIERERFGDGERAAFVDGLAGLTPGKRARLIDGLPIVQDGGRAREFEIVGERDPLDPLSPAVGDADRPCACAFVAPVAQGDAGTDRRPVGFLAHGEFAAGGSAFEASIARLGHWKFSSVSGQCPKYRSGAPWKAMDGYGLETRYCNMLHQRDGSMWNVMERKF